jgi:hypothetical protein
MRKTLVLAVGCLTLAGCAAIARLECDTDWYETGRRDGILGADSQLENYAARCGGKLDRGRYAEGLQVGLGMRPRISAF